MTTADEWNRQHPVGTTVNAWPGTREGAGLRTKTRSKAWMLGSGEHVVAVKGYPGGISLEHVDVVDESLSIADQLREYVADYRNARKVSHVVGEGVSPAIVQSVIIALASVLEVES